jgi:hypothetical protein
VLIPREGWSEKKMMTGFALYAFHKGFKENTKKLRLFTSIAFHRDIQSLNLSPVGIRTVGKRSLLM